MLFLSLIDISYHSRFFSPRNSVAIDVVKTYAHYLLSLFILFRGPIVRPLFLFYYLHLLPFFIGNYCDQIRGTTLYIHVLQLKNEAVLDATLSSISDRVTNLRTKNHSRFRQFWERAFGLTILRMQKPQSKLTDIPFYQCNHVRERRNNNA